MTTRRKYLRIPDEKWKRYQHYQSKSADPDWKPAWIKLYVRLLDDFHLRHIPPEARFVYIGLLLIAAETHNLIPSSSLFLSQRLTISVSEASRLVELLLKNGLVEPYSAKKSRPILGSVYSLRQEVRGKKLESTGSTTDVPPVPADELPGSHRQQVQEAVDSFRLEALKAILACCRDRSDSSLAALVRASEGLPEGSLAKVRESCERFKGELGVGYAINAFKSERSERGAA